MAKKTGFMKVLGRNSYTVIHKINKLEKAPFKEVVAILDFTNGK